MKKKYKILIGLAVFNEEDKLTRLLQNMDKVIRNSDYFLLIVNDHSTDNSPKYLSEFVKKQKNAKLVTNKKNYGIGKSIKTIIDYGLKNNFDICVFMAGNGKDNPLEIKKLLSPIIDKGFDYVQGSRFLHGGSFNNLPFLRKMMIKGFTFMFYLFTGLSQTDTSNGYRAYKLNIFRDKRINIHQSWLNRYELETYVHYKVITLGYKICEVAVSKDYLPGIKNYSKIRPIIDWWSMMSPLFYLKLKMRN